MGGVEVGQGRSEHCLILRVGYPMATSSYPLPPPLLDYLCIFLIGVGLRFSKVIAARSARTPARWFEEYEVLGVICFLETRALAQ